MVRSTIVQQLDADGIDAVISTGGTGITSRDSTYEAVSSLLDKRLDGFGVNCFACSVTSRWAPRR